MTCQPSLYTGHKWQNPGLHTPVQASCPFYTPSSRSAHTIAFQVIYLKYLFPKYSPSTASNILSRFKFFVFHHRSLYEIQSESWRFGRWASPLCALEMLPREWVGFLSCLFYLPPPHKLQQGHKTITIWRVENSNFKRLKEGIIFKDNYYHYFFWFGRKRERNTLWINRTLGPQSLSLIYLGVVYLPESSFRGKNNNYCLIIAEANFLFQF